MSCAQISQTHGSHAFYHVVMVSCRLITFNIAHGRGLSPYQGFHSARYIEQNLRKITKVLADSEADFVALQEVDEDSYWNRHINLLEVIRRETPYHFGHIGLNNVRTGAQRLNYGNAILSRHAIGFRHNQPFGNEKLGGKGFMYVELEVHGEMIPLVNVHLDFRSRLRRIAQINQVIEFIESRSDDREDRVRPIICGDFNCAQGTSGDAVQRLFDALERDKHYRVVPERVRTFPAHLPARTIDLVLMPHRFEVKRVEVLPVYLSDHRPVLVEFEARSEADERRWRVANG